MTVGALWNTVLFLLLLGLLKAQPIEQIMKNIRKVSVQVVARSTPQNVKREVRTRADIAKETLPIIVSSYKVSLEHLPGSSSKVTFRFGPWHP